MRVIARSLLKHTWIKPYCTDSEQPLKVWYDEVKHAKWKKASDIKIQYRNVILLPNNRAVFIIGKNKYCLVVAIKYDFGICCVRFVGTRKQYEKIDAKTI